MTYYYDVRTTVNPNSTSLIKDMVIGVAQSAGYTIVDTTDVTSSSWVIFKNPASVNSVTDFNIGFGHANSIGLFQIILCESWNVNSKTANGYAPFSINPDIVTWRAESANAYLPGSSNWMFASQVAVRSGGTIDVWAKEKTFVICVTNSSIANALSNTTKKTIFAGLYETILPASADPIPLGIITIFDVACFSTASQQPYTHANDGRFTRTAGFNSRLGFNANLYPLNNVTRYVNKYTTNFVYSKAIMAFDPNLKTNAPTGQRSISVRGIHQDIFFAYNSGPSNARTSWTFAGSQYYGRNINDHKPAYYAYLNSNPSDQPEARLVILE